MNALTITGHIRTAETDGKPYLLVGTKCVERPDLPTRYGIGLKITHQALAQRLVRAINAGVVFTDVCIKTDVHEQEYVSFTNTINTRVLNAELKRKGF